MALARLGRPDEAVAEYLRALELEPGNADAAYNLKRARERGGGKGAEPWRRKRKDRRVSARGEPEAAGGPGAGDFDGEVPGAGASDTGFSSKTFRAWSLARPQLAAGTIITGGHAGSLIGTIPFPSGRPTVTSQGSPFSCPFFQSSIRAAGGSRP